MSMNKGWLIICGAIGLLTLGVAISVQSSAPDTESVPYGVPIDGDHDNFSESLHARASNWLDNQMGGDIQ